MMANSAGQDTYYLKIILLVHNSLHSFYNLVQPRNMQKYESVKLEQLLCLMLIGRLVFTMFSLYSKPSSSTN